MKTVKALLTFEVLTRVHPKAKHYFCSDPQWLVVCYEAEQASRSSQSGVS